MFNLGQFFCCPFNLFYLMLPFLAAAGLTGFSSAMDMLGNYLSAQQNYTYSRRLNEQQFDFQNQLMDKQNQWNLDQWNRENEYNSAAAQVDRLRAAGLNPGIVFGNNAGTASPLVSSSPSVGSSAVADFMRPISFGQTLNSYLANTIANKELKVREDMLDKQLTREDKRIDNERNRIESEVGLNEIIGREKEQNIHFSQEQEKALRASVRQMNKNMDVMDKTLQLYDSQISENNALAQKALQEGNVIQYRAISERMNAISNRINANAYKELSKSQIKVADSQVDLNYQQGLHLIQQIRNLERTEALQNIELTWKDKQYKADLELKQGQLRIVHIQGDVQDATQYAQIADAYIKTVDNACHAVSSAAGAFVDSSTAGASTILRGQGAINNQNAQTNMYNSFGQGGYSVPVAGFSLGR